MSGPSLTPPTPIELRDWLVADHTTYLRSIGVEPDLAAVERLVKADLGMVDAAERSGDLKQRTAPSPPVRRAADPAAELATERGYELTRAPIKAAPAPRRGRMIERHRKLMVRMKALLARYPGERAAVGWWDGFMFPAFAKDIMEAQLQWKFHLREHRGKSKADRDRILIRRLEDIADRSTGVMGAWWVK